MHYVIGDITKAADMQTLVDETISNFGGVHNLVDSASMPRDKELVKMSEEDAACRASLAIRCLAKL